MQVTEIQVEQSLRALQEVADGLDLPGHDLADLPDGLLELLLGIPAVRLDRMADAKMRLAAGRQPTDDDLARRLVGRLVCDRLR